MGKWGRADELGGRCWGGWLFVVAVAWVMGAAGQSAPSVYWETTNGDWGVADSWAPSVVPGSGTNAFIDNSGAAVVSAPMVGLGGGWIWVGSNAPGNSLVVASGGALSSYVGIIGQDLSSMGNLVALSGVGSSWNIQYQIEVGHSGGGNSLQISDGGHLAAGMSYVGHESTSCDNVVTVTGPGSLWTQNNKFFVGYGGSGNALRIEDGGRVDSRVGAYVGYFSWGSNNSAIVTDPGSLWWNERGIRINQSEVVISNGGTMLTAYDSGIGDFFPGNGRMVVTGSGSSWTNNGITVGVYGGNSSLRIEDGAAVVRWYTNHGSSVIGYDEGQNVVTVSGAGSLWQACGDLTVGDRADQNRLAVTNGGLVDSLGATISAYFSADMNHASVTGAGSLWTNWNDLIVGQNGDRGLVTVEAGGRLVSGGASLGNTTFSHSNSVVVGGAGSDLEIVRDLIVGREGSSNSLRVTDGGMARVGGSLVVGAEQSSGTNLVLVTGADSVLNGGGSLTVGDAGSGNLLRIEDGGWVGAGEVGVSHLAGASGNVIEIDGGTLTAASNVTVGAAGSLRVISGTLVAGGVVTNQGNLSGGGTFVAAQILNQGQATFSGIAQIQAPYRNASGATTEVSHASGAVFLGAVTNEPGAIFKNTSGVVRFLDVFENGGSYVSDPATNLFTTLSVGPSGSVVGGAGDVFVFEGDFLNKSTNAGAFDMAGAEVQFTGGGDHAFELVGEEMGRRIEGYSTNFALGILTLGSGDLLTILDGNPANAGAALYLDVFNAQTNQVTSEFNVYYNGFNNPDLNWGTYELSGGGFLMPIPEPGCFVVLLGCCILLVGARLSGKSDAAGHR